MKELSSTQSIASEYAIPTDKEQLWYNIKLIEESVEQKNPI